ncbi:MurR/RpiR family transcriptional regulator [Sporolactobacillus shoreicorticis]|uniref:MurR/RpiR family transcriptional regulator n=1 Tax=Sporolactobacillus shoreicorticis TaxID=1923877 RepID=A0ABW5S1E4_9BACL|nr:MurR/RpiR family transcriptional regulator [Sporolactobacillus shoreicorticis]MCO7125285.1 MurR/RpiR family transcriptional regulator [Sporolactobacillus shoreicorticis]
MDFKTNSKDFQQLLGKIARVAHESPTYEKLAYTIEKGYKHIIFMTASEVAEQADVSQGSVSRFCIALGYKGYNDFLHHLQQFVRKEITAPQRLQFTTHSNKNISNILKLEHENIDALEPLLERPEYKQMIDQIIHADQVILLSARMSATLLSYTYYILNKIRANVVQVTPGTPAWETLELMDPARVHIFSFVFPRYPNQLLEKLKNLHHKGFSISSITDSITSPVYAVADPVLSVPITTSSIFDIYSTPILFLNLLLREVATATDGLDKRMAALESLEKRDQIYYETYHYDATLE